MLLNNYIFLITEKFLFNAWKLFESNNLTRMYGDLHNNPKI